MPVLRIPLALLPAALVLLLAGPAAAQEGDGGNAAIGFPVAMLVLVVVAVVFALVWRAVSRRRQGGER